MNISAFQSFIMKDRYKQTIVIQNDKFYLTGQYQVL